MSICKDCFHSYVCEQFNEHRECDNKKCHFANDHFVPTDLINRLQAENERLNNLKRFEKFICERIHTDKERNLTWDFATKEAEQEAFEQELEKLFDISTARAEAYKECIARVNEIITENYNKHIFDSNDLNDEEKDAVINFSDDVTYAIGNLLKEMVGK